MMHVAPICRVATRQGSGTESNTSLLNTINAKPQRMKQVEVAMTLTVRRVCSEKYVERSTLAEAALCITKSTIASAAEAMGIHILSIFINASISAMLRASTRTLPVRAMRNPTCRPMISGGGEGGALDGVGGGGG